MAFVKINVSTGTIQQLDRRYRGVREAIKNLDDRHKLLEEIKQGQVDRWAQDFMSGGDPEWTPTSPSQKERRVKQGFSPTPTLIRSGATMAHFFSQNEEGNVGAASITWSFSNRKGAYTVSHHTGYGLGRSTIPSRMLWNLDSEDQDIIAEQIEEFVEAQLDDL